MIQKIRFYVAPGLLAAGLLLCVGRPAEAYPLLMQLDIQNGVYSTPTTDTTVATTKLFTLYAYPTPASGTTSTELAALLDDTYYLAAALTPKVTTSQNLGSFTFNGATIHATSDMVYGDPPLERYLGGIATYDPGDMARDLLKHDIYDTYFKEFSFKFLSTQRANAYDAPTSSANGPTLNPNGGMYYMAFQVDTSLLNTTYQVHFDLYSETRNGNDLDININRIAPFTHDAQSGNFLQGSAVPEPASLVLLGTGVIGLVAHYRRRRGTTK